MSSPNNETKLHPLYLQTQQSENTKKENNKSYVTILRGFTFRWLKREEKNKINYVKIKSDAILHPVD